MRSADATSQMGSPVCRVIGGVGVRGGSGSESVGGVGGNGGDGGRFWLWCPSTRGPVPR